VKIDSSQIQLQASHNQETGTKTSFEFRYWDQFSSLEVKSGQDDVQISAQARTLFEAMPAPSSHPPEKNQSEEQDSSEETKFLPEPSEKDKQKLYLAKRLLRSLKGSKGEPDVEERSASRSTCKSLKITTVTNSGPKPQALPESQGFGLELKYHQTRVEKEQTSFLGEGIVKTKDGKTFAVSVSQMMNRSFTSEFDVDIKAGEAVKDPLVINYSAPTAVLTGEKYDFDLDANGSTDKISFAAPGSGFLARDKNGDGVINDGSELFGALTGQGFAELSALDADKNGWIDENDPVFDQLLVWSKDQNGADQYGDLRSLGIGAIYLGSTATPFALNNAENKSEGHVKATGLFVRENGEAGTVQQLDLTV